MYAVDSLYIFVVYSPVGTHRLSTLMRCGYAKEQLTYEYLLTVQSTARQALHARRRMNQLKPLPSIVGCDLMTYKRRYIPTSNHLSVIADRVESRKVVLSDDV